MYRERVWIDGFGLERTLSLIAPSAVGVRGMKYCTRTLSTLLLNLKNSRSRQRRQINARFY